MTIKQARAGRGRNKFGARKTEVDGIVFHSAKEARRYMDLKLLERAGEIRGLKLQPRYPLTVNGLHVATYVADFEYSDPDGRVTTEDSKGYRTREFITKAKLFHALYGREVVLT